MKTTVHKITSTDELQNLIATDSTLVVVDFFAEWCGPCKIMAPIFDQVAQENPSVVFAKIDVDAVSDLASEYNISSIPTVVFIKGGTVVEQTVGALSSAQLNNKIAKHLL